MYHTDCYTPSCASSQWPFDSCFQLSDHIINWSSRISFGLFCDHLHREMPFSDCKLSTFCLKLKNWSSSRAQGVSRKCVELLRRKSLSAMFHPVTKPVTPFCTVYQGENGTVWPCMQVGYRHCACAEETVDLWENTYHALTNVPEEMRRKWLTKQHIIWYPLSTVNKDSFSHYVVRAFSRILVSRVGDSWSCSLEHQTLVSS